MKKKIERKIAEKYGRLLFEKLKFVEVYHSITTPVHTGDELRSHIPDMTQWIFKRLISMFIFDIIDEVEGRSFSFKTLTDELAHVTKEETEAFIKARNMDDSGIKLILKDPNSP